MGPKRDPGYHKKPQVTINPLVPYSISSYNGRIKFLAPCNCVLSKFQIHLSKGGEVTIDMGEADTVVLPLEAGTTEMEYDPIRLNKGAIVSIITESDSNFMAVSFMLRVS